MRDSLDSQLKLLPLAVAELHRTNGTAATRYYFYNNRINGKTRVTFVTPNQYLCQETVDRSYLVQSLALHRQI